MPEIRQNIATKEWVIISTERAKRPEDFKTSKQKEPLPEFSEKCPFCPGNEEKTPYETYVVNGPNGKWKLRSVPNKFPALISDLTLERKNEGIKRSISGVGNCEVIVESPIHNTTMALMPENDVRDILLAYKNRYLCMSSDPRMKLIVIFRNHGLNAGASIEHPHSQIFATPVIPFHIRTRLEEAMRYHDETGECVFCKITKDELNEKKRVVVETGSFLSIVPYAALSPFHMWLLPKRHMSTFAEINDNELNDLARNLKTTLAKIYYGLDNPDFNFAVRTGPIADKEVEHYHWYITITLRLLRTAGFEIGSGMYINSSIPEENAKYLREIKTR
ncbi:MAG: galactose-1-phosphate uridylyltransferase [Elusimicrobia bacterium CG1_02_37_114]|nr:MAG: galactose-1-phosphate uridylyltransferase [Elusimicrobia bacterium CG1_02_37_114]PIV53776.1 MAG: galactose-1-phosphate uridylyltransferase [Elusimicrobia bacterium CG02_land_8_20_14_3_00_37_13]PIZ13328.1 MAG: galactose-1-phosphate uridylyltransferase [Elusimicrobia bacterium CG_4_10_14_0_8_um_filter_37_32]